MKMKPARIWFFLAVAASIIRNAMPVYAQGGVAVENVGAVYVFGEQITFYATIKASSPVQNARIVIFDEGQGITHAQPLSIDADGSARYVFDVQRNALRPFTNVRWLYEFVLADGRTTQSESFFIRYDDNRFAWQKIESNGLRMFWFQGDADFGQKALDTALAGLRTINEFFSVDLRQPVDIFVYPSKNELSLLGVDSWTAGQANPPMGVAFVVVTPGLEQSVQMEQRIPHELMHVLSYRHLGAGYDNLPVWLSEGLATLVEINPTAEYERVLFDAAARDGLIPMPDLCASFPRQPDLAFLAYAEARSFTGFLRSTYGSSKLLDLARAYVDGVTCERGVEIVYGTSLAQLDFMWRESLLGQGAWGAAIENMIPYLILLCLVLGIPLAIGFNAVWKKK